MSTKKRLSALAATLSCVLWVGAIPAGAATPECGAQCGSVFSRELGTYADPGVVEAVLDGVARVGQPVVLKQASSSDPSEDLIPRPGMVSDFYAAGLVSAEVDARYGPLLAVQQEYAPYGDPTGLCVGLAATASQNQGLTLQPCGVSARTVWILDTPSSPPTAPGFFPIVNGSTTRFDRPYAMDLPRDEIVNDRRPLQIHVRQLKFLGPEKTLPDSQLWGFIPGVLR